MIGTMNAPPTCAGKRKLLYIPIIHTAADMGTLGASIRGKKLSTLGRQGLTRNAAVVEKMWEKIERVVAHLPLDQGTARLYPGWIAGLRARAGHCRSWLERAAETTGCCWNLRRAARP